MYNTCIMSNIIRYSFRIQCHRKPPYNCFIYAGGFDECNQLFLGEGLYDIQFVFMIRWHHMGRPN